MAPSGHFEEIFMTMGLCSPILRRRLHLSTKFGRGIPRPARIEEHASRQGHQIGFAARNDLVRLLRFRDETDGNDRKERFFFDAFGQWHLIVRANGDLLQWREASRGNMKVGAAPALKFLGEDDALIDIPPTGHPVSSGDSDANRFVTGKGGANGIKDLKGEAHSVFQRSTVVVGSLIGERGEKLMQEVAVSGVQFNGINSESICTAGCCHKGILDVFQARFIKGDRFGIVRIEGNRRGSKNLQPPSEGGTTP
jgi:hypothetical protein